jgi:hypothetical protein
MYTQEVPRTSDRAPSRTFYLWLCDWRAAAQRHGVDLLRAAGNVNARLNHELNAEQEV